MTEEGVQRKRVNQRRSRTVEKGEGRKEQVELGIVRRKIKPNKILDNRS